MKRFPLGDGFYQITSCDLAVRPQASGDLRLISTEAIEQIRKQKVFCGKGEKTTGVNR